MKRKRYKPRGSLWQLFTFSGYIGMGEFWSELGVRLIYLVCAAIILCIAIVVLIPGTTQELIAITDVAVPVLAVIWAIPIIAMTRRRLRDAGYSAKSYLWLLLPVIGWLIFVLRLCGKSK
jgi:uncharacterized membrane protein YhaH (DUF805 family)